MIWLVLAIVFLGVSIFALDGVQLYRMAKRGIETDGIVIAKEPKNHLFIRYSYSAGGQVYQGVGNAGRGNPKFEDLNLGDKVKVYFDPSNPSKSLVGNPQLQFESITRGILFLTVFGPAFCLLALYVKGWLPGFSNRRDRGP